MTSPFLDETWGGARPVARVGRSGPKGSEESQPIRTSFFRYICTRFHYLLSLDNEVLETSKRRAMFYNILSQNFIVKCFTKSLLFRIPKSCLLTMLCK